MDVDPDTIVESSRAAIALGSNLGNRTDNIYDAIAAIGSIPHTRVLLSSTLHETPPVGPQDQPDYLNAAATVQTALEPQAMLAHLLAIEQSLGRDRSKEIRWGARTIDLDILLFVRNDQSIVLEMPSLTIPHPRMHQRTFVLMPLAEIAHDWLHPKLKKSVADLLAGCW